MSNDNRDQGERSGHSHREEDHDDQPLLMRTSPRKDFDGDFMCNYSCVLVERDESLQYFLKMES